MAETKRRTRKPAANAEAQAVADKPAEQAAPAADQPDLTLNSTFISLFGQLMAEGGGIAMRTQNGGTITAREWASMILSGQLPPVLGPKLPEALKIEKSPYRDDAGNIIVEDPRKAMGIAPKEVPVANDAGAQKQAEPQEGSAWWDKDDFDLDQAVWKKLTTTFTNFVGVSVPADHPKNRIYSAGNHDNAGVWPQNNQSFIRAIERTFGVGFTPEQRTQLSHPDAVLGMFYDAIRSQQKA